MPNEELDVSNVDCPDVETRSSGAAYQRNSSLHPGRSQSAPEAAALTSFINTIGNATSSDATPSPHPSMTSSQPSSMTSSRQPPSASPSPQQQTATVDRTHARFRHRQPHFQLEAIPLARSSCSRSCDDDDVVTSLASRADDDVTVSFLTFKPPESADEFVKPEEVEPPPQRVDGGDDDSEKFQTDGLPSTRVAGQCVHESMTSQESRGVPAAFDLIKHSKSIYDDVNAGAEEYPV